MYCDVNRATEQVASICKAVKGYKEECTWEYEVTAGHFCEGQNVVPTCEKLWQKYDNQIPRDARQGQSGLAYDDVENPGLRCTSSVKFKYGPLVNPTTNRLVWYDVLGYN